MYLRIIFCSNLIDFCEKDWNTLSKLCPRFDKDDVTLEKESVAEGGFASVYYGEIKDDFQVSKIAAKRLIVTNDTSPEKQKKMRREIALLW